MYSGEAIYTCVISSRKMKLKATSIFILLSVFFLYKIDKSHLHSQQYLANQNVKADNLASANYVNNYYLQDESGSKFSQDVFQNDDQIDEEDETFDANYFNVLQNKLFSFFNAAVFTYHGNNNIKSALEALSSRKYILFSVFRI